MIESFRHKGLKRLFETGDTRGILAEHARKLRQVLAALDVATSIEAMDLPTFRLHPLKGDLRSLWSVTVRANWRVTFRFEEGRASDVDLVDYH